MTATAMEGAMGTVMATRAMVGVTATAMEGVTTTRQQRRLNGDGQRCTMALDGTRITRRQGTCYFIITSAPSTPAITLHYAFGGLNHDDSVQVDTLTTPPPQTSSPSYWQCP